jgi:probable HAF family extracellular repeat protein
MPGLSGATDTAEGGALVRSGGVAMLFAKTSCIHALFAGCLLVSTAARCDQYRIVDLGVNFIPRVIDDRLDVLGVGHHDGPYSNAWLLRKGVWSRVGKKPDYPDVFAINERGDMAGSNDNDAYPAVFPRTGGVSRVDLPEGGTQGVAASITLDRTVVGQFYGDGRYRCFLTPWHGQSIDIGFPSAKSTSCRPVAINERGWIAGFSIYDDGNGTLDHGFIWKDGQFNDLGAQAQGGTDPWAMNQLGHVVGVSGGKAFLWNGRQMIDIGESDVYHGTTAQSINDRGQIVGWGVDPELHLHALRFDHAGVVALESEVSDLGDWQLQLAVSIDNEGRIVGEGVRGKRGHGFMLVPMRGN